MELPDGQKPFDIVEVRFKNDRKNYYRKPSDIDLQTGDIVAVEASPGHDMGVISMTGELVRLQMKKRQVKDTHEIRKLFRKATESDIEKWQEARSMEKETMLRTRSIAKELNLIMKVSDVEYQGDRSKATFYYTADGRVDFRELIRKLADTFKIRVEMKQIGMRQEAGRLGGIGSCGRELCCSTWLTDFRSVSTSSARYQQLALNPQKLAGQCGKLKCCLNYELDQYVEALKDFPSTNVKLDTEKGTAVHFKTDIFRRIVYYIYEKQAGGSPTPMTLENAHKVIEMNKKGQKPDSLSLFEIEQNVVEETVYANVVGQDSLTRFDRPKRRKGRKGRRPQKNTSGNASQGSPKKSNKSRGRSRNRKK
jgi:cell fate regulator YaaT (PSP1 superfamily)